MIKEMPGMFLKTVSATATKNVTIGLWIVLFLAVAHSPVTAQTRYVTDEWSLPVRSGPGTDRKIFAFLKSSNRVQVLSQEEDWSKIVLTDGREGWVLSRYLTIEKPSKLVLSELQSEHSSLSSETKDLTEENQQLKSENKTLSSKLQTIEKEFKQLTTEHETLRKSADTKREELHKWMVLLFSGAGILFFGILLGFLLKKPRRTSGLL
jgi:SH3 domain protein